MSKQRHDLPELTPAQGEIMDIIWERGEASASEVRTDPLANPRGGPQHGSNAAGTHGREGLDHSSRGRPDVPVLRRPSPARRPIGQKVREVVETVCGGSAEALVTALLDYRGLSSGELERIRADARPGPSHQEGEGGTR